MDPMDPIDLLTAEHQLILSALDALDGYARRVRRNEPVERGDLARFVSFVRGFADGRHHGKEEEILFAAMVEQGFPRDAGPIAVMLAEHEENRALTRAMADAIERDGAWSDAERRRLAEAALAYADLLRRHIWKEDNVLYPMARTNLDPAAYAQVGDACAAFERGREEEGAAARATIEELRNRYARA